MSSFQKAKSKNICYKSTTESEKKVKKVTFLGFQESLNKPFLLVNEVDTHSTVTYDRKKHFLVPKTEGSMKTIKQVLMARDGISAEEANAEIESAREDLHNRLEDGEMPFDICGDWFGLEPDYMEELML